jgi:two-component system, OmpR family, response regulator
MSGIHPWQMRVLVVEDNPEMAVGLAGLLRTAGHEVEIAPDGPSAVEAAQSRPPDVLLLDIGLPSIDGYEVARRVQEQPGPKRPFLVAVTGRDTNEDRCRSEEAGIDLHLTKPVDPNGLQRLLGRFRSVIAED